MDQRPSNPLRKPWTVGDGRGMEEGREGREVATDPGRISTTFRED